MRSVIFTIIRYSGFVWLLREVFYARCVIILCLHNPSPDVASRYFRVLSKLYNVIPLAQYLEAIKQSDNKLIPKKTLVITFDDAWKENYELLPILKQQEVPVTIFACSAIIGTNRHFWWTKATNIVTSAELEQMTDKDRIKVLADLGFEETLDYESPQALSVEQIQRMKKWVDFQSHTRFHPALPQCDKQRLEAEISGSKLELEEKIGANVFALAFPNGRYGDREIESVKQAGYQCALTTDEGVNTLMSDRFRLKRIDIPDKVDTNELIVKVSGAWHFIKRII